MVPSILPLQWQTVLYEKSSLRVAIYDDQQVTRAKGKRFTASNAAFFVPFSRMQIQSSWPSNVASHENTAGHKISTALVAAINYKDKSRARRKGGKSRAVSNVHVNLDHQIEAKAFIEKVGTVRAAKAAIQGIEKLGAPVRTFCHRVQANRHFRVLVAPSHDSEVDQPAVIRLVLRNWVCRSSLRHRRLAQVSLDRP